MTLLRVLDCDASGSCHFRPRVVHTARGLNDTIGHYLRQRLQASTRAVHADGECSAPVFPAILFIRLSLFGCRISCDAGRQPNGDNRMETTEWGQPNETHEKQRNGKPMRTLLEHVAFQVFKNVSLMAA